MFDLKNKNISVKKSILLMTVCILTGCLLSAAVFASSPLTFQTITSGIVSGAPTYTIFQDNNVYYAKNEWGMIAYSGSDFSTVFNSVSVDGNKNIKITAGIYTAITPLYLYRNLFIEGAGVGNTYIHAEETTAFYAYGNATYQFWSVHISDLTINGTDSTSTYGIYLSYTYSNVEIVNVEIKHFESGIKMSECYAVRVSNFECNYNTYAGLDLYTVQGSTFIQGKVYGNQHGIVLNLGTGTSLSAIDFEDNTGTGLIITTNPSGTYRTNKAEVYGNYFEGNNKDIADRGIASSIRDNYFVDTKGVNYAITVENASSTIEANFFKYYNVAAIWIVSGATNGLIYGNTIEDIPNLITDNGADTRQENNRNETSWIT